MNKVHPNKQFSKSITKVRILEFCLKIAKEDIVKTKDLKWKSCSTPNVFANDQDLNSQGATNISSST